MGSRSDAYGSGEWLKQDQLKADFGGVFKGTINGSGMHEFDDGKKQIFITFDETDYKLGLNATNFDTITEGVESDDYELWPQMDIQVEAYIDPNVRMAGKKVGGVRVRNVKAGQGVAPSSDVAILGADGGDKLIEFVEAQGCSVEQIRTSLHSMGVVSSTIASEPSTWPVTVKAKLKEAVALAQADIPF